jgi:ubiquinone/menaquinone biosynthesis C-methylase UbiE
MQAAPKYQHDYSKIRPAAVFDHESRTRKAHTVLCVLQNHVASRLQDLTLLDIGCSAGIIADALASHLKKVVGIDIDANALQFAHANFRRPNLAFSLQDSLCMAFPDHSFNLAVCAHVYEHVPDPAQLLAEIHRVLRPGGICYFAAGNRLAVREPHYSLPFLSFLPPALANQYLKCTGKGGVYHERHLTLWGLRRLVRRFSLADYTSKLVEHPQRYGLNYALQEGTRRHRLAKLIVRHFYWLCPTYIWLLEKAGPPAGLPPQRSGFNLCA